ncbi:hypothetical protein BTUL_0342g00040 [Botrytis tulipae]|uniref:Rhodopsin domain-containing protein n=1 Tax=Botrytis tulipae TaxID=87230 RepID=A0A4Z1ECE7_9HELO|nr:hypothetical protein BTUL_0342g00040 [Botrytis tulipae]
MKTSIFQRADPFDASQIPDSVAAKIRILPPPPGVASNFVNPANTRSLLLAFCGMGFAMIALCVTIRIWVIFKILRPIKWAWSDIGFALAIFATMATYIILTLASTGFGQFGIHSWNVSVYKVLSFRSRAVNASCALVPAISSCLIKITIFLMYLELFAALKTTRILCFIGVGVTAIFYIIIITLTALWSFPLSIYFVVDNTIKGQSLNIPKGIFGLVVDIYLFLIPLVAVSALKSATIRKKLGILLVFSTGGLAILSASFSIYWRVYLQLHSDHMWYLTPLWIVYITEHSFGLIIANTTHFARFFRCYGSAIEYYLCCRFARSGEQSEKSEKRSEVSSESEPVKVKTTIKLYPGLDVTTVERTTGGTMLGIQDGQAKTEQASTNPHPVGGYLAETHWVER